MRIKVDVKTKVKLINDSLASDSVSLHIRAQELECVRGEIPEFDMLVLKFKDFGIGPVKKVN